MAEPVRRRRRGRPSEGPRVAVRLPREVVAALDDRARREGSTRAKVLRGIVTASVGSPVDDGIDRSQIRRQLALSPAQRVEHMVRITNTLHPIRGIAARR